VADNTRKPAETKSATPAASPTATASAKPAAAKPAARARKTTAAAPAARRNAPATARSTTAAAKKTAHEPEPFVAKGNKAGKPPKAKKAKLIRDSFTMPDGEYAQIAALKKRCLDAGVSAKKSEILRAAVANLAKLSDASVVAAIRRLEVIKTGRPTKGSK
jgi:hypothetical protein